MTDKKTRGKKKMREEVEGGFKSERVPALLYSHDASSRRAADGAGFICELAVASSL